MSFFAKKAHPLPLQQQQQQPPLAAVSKPASAPMEPFPAAKLPPPPLSGPGNGKQSWDTLPPSSGLTAGLTKFRSGGTKSSAREPVGPRATTDSAEASKSIAKSVPSHNALKSRMNVPHLPSSATPFTHLMASKPPQLAKMATKRMRHESLEHASHSNPGRSTEDAHPAEFENFQKLSLTVGYETTSTAPDSSVDENPRESPSSPTRYVMPYLSTPERNGTLCSDACSIASSGVDASSVEGRVDFEEYMRKWEAAEDEQWQLLQRSKDMFIQSRHGFALRYTIALQEDVMPTMSPRLLEHLGRLDKIKAKHSHYASRQLNDCTASYMPSPLRNEIPLDTSIH